MGEVERGEQSYSRHGADGDVRPNLRSRRSKIGGGVLLSPRWKNEDWGLLGFSESKIVDRTCQIQHPGIVDNCPGRLFGGTDKGNPM